MPNWTVRLTAGTVDQTGQSPNITLTLVATNSVSNETQTRTLSGAAWTINSVKAAADDFIRQLNQRDVSVALVNAALAGGPVTLSTG